MAFDLENKRKVATHAHTFYRQKFQNPSAPSFSQTHPHLCCFSECELIGGARDVSEDGDLAQAIRRTALPDWNDSGLWTTRQFTFMPISSRCSSVRRAKLLRWELKASNYSSVSLQAFMLDDVRLSLALINGCLPLCFPILQLPCIYASSPTFFDPATKHPSTWCSARFPYNLHFFPHSYMIPSTTGLHCANFLSIKNLYRCCSYWLMLNWFGRSWRLDAAFFYFKNSQVISPMVSRAGNYFRCTARPYLLPSIFCIVYDYLDYMFLS